MRLAGKEYKITFTLKALKEIEKKCGTLDNVGELLAKENFAVQMHWLIGLGINAAIARDNCLNGTDTPPFTEEYLEMVLLAEDFRGAYQEIILEFQKAQKPYLDPGAADPNPTAS